MLVRSWSSDAGTGSEGVIAAAMEGGYAVTITGLFSDALGNCKVEQRCLFFGHDEVRRLQ